MRGEAAEQAADDVGDLSYAVSRSPHRLGKEV